MLETAIKHCVSYNKEGYNITVRKFEFYLRVLTISFTSEQSEQVKVKSSREAKVGISKRKINSRENIFIYARIKKLYFTSQ